MFNLKRILRALLFSTSEPLTIKDVQAVISRYHAEQDALRKKNAAAKDAFDAEAGDSPDSLSAGEQSVIEDIIVQVPTLLTATQIREAMEEIAADLDENSEVFRLVQSSSGFKLVISKEYADWVRLLRDDPRPQRLSRAALETLAIIAYRQPVTRAEIEAIRGVNADGAISRLTEKELIFISGRADLPGRPLQYSTTQNFLDYIGVNSIEELPASDVLSPNQISEWIKRASSPAEVKDKEMGLPQDDSEAQSEVSDAREESQYRGQAEAPERAQTDSDKKIEAEFGDVSREIEVPGDAAAHFPYDGAESAGSQEEFEPTSDNSDGGSEQYNDKAEI